MIAMVDVQPPYFGDQLSRTDIVFDHHPQPVSYEASFKDIRVKYGATSTILTRLSKKPPCLKISHRRKTTLCYTRAIAAVNRTQQTRRSYGKV